MARRCGGRRAGAGAAPGRRQKQRDHCGARVAAQSGVGGLHRDARRHGLPETDRYGAGARQRDAYVACLKANVHFPTDWVLLRDAVRTLVQAILVIRRHGLRKRIPAPEGFLREINQLSKGMSAAGAAQAGIKEGVCLKTAVFRWNTSEIRQVGVSRVGLRHPPCRLRRNAFAGTPKTRRSRYGSIRGRAAFP